MTEFAVFVEGLKDVDFSNSGDQIAKVASKAINGVTRKSRAEIKRRIRSEVNFPVRFLDGKGLQISQFAKPTDLESIITARGRPTMLSRFLTSAPRSGRAGVSVEVEPGKARFMRRVFSLKLPQGSAGVETKYNLALAIRLRKGERLRNKTSFRRLESNLYVLYGPSVDQVFRAKDGDGIATDMVPKIERDLEKEFLRLIDL